MPSRSDQEIEAEVFRLIEEVTNVPVAKLTLETRVGHDLGVDGDDAVEILMALKKRYSVDISAFKFDEHFGTEGWDPFRAIYHLFRRTANKLKPLRIRDIVEAVKRGYLR